MRSLSPPAGHHRRPAAALRSRPAATDAQLRPCYTCQPSRNRSRGTPRPGARCEAYLHPVRPSVAFNLIDGLIRMTFFLIMIFSFSLLKDIRRVFQYHGAEHKTVFTWEAGLPLTVDNARPQPRQHPRCGTSFLMVVMLVAIVLFSVIKFDSLFLNFLVRLALMPLVAGLSYEIIRLSAKKESGWFFKLITRPGVWLQNITTQEPDDQQLEVAIEALKESLKLEPQTRRAGAGAACRNASQDRLKGLMKSHVRKTRTNRKRVTKSLTQELSSPELLADPSAYGKAAKQHRALGEIVEKYQHWKSLKNELAGARELFDTSDDEEMREMARLEVETLQAKLDDD